MNHLPLSGTAPRIAVVIPTRNRATSLPRAVASVLASKRADIELAVVDDGSQDETAAWLASVGDPRLVWRRMETHCGANRARNEGAAMTSAPLIAFLDSDDAFVPGRIDRLIEVFDANPDIGCMIDGFSEISDTRRRIHRLPAGVPAADDLRQLLLFHSIPLTNSTLTVRRAAFEAAGGYDPDLGRHQDREFLLRLTRSQRIAMGDAVDVLKHRGNNSISRDHSGYIAGLDQFVARCPEYGEPGYDSVLAYLTVRGILKALLQGRLDVVFAETAAWRRAGNLPGGLHALSRYFAGRLQRRRLAERLPPSAGVRGASKAGDAAPGKTATIRQSGG